jgi:hypothetical protein
VESLLKIIELFNGYKYKHYAIVIFFFLSLFVGFEIKSNGILKDYLTEKNKNLKAYDESIRLIDSQLETIRATYGADWAAISMFHNGEILLNGLHMRKFSRIYEAREYLKVDKRHLIRGVGFAPFVELYDNMMLEGYVNYYDPKQLKNPFYVQYIFQNDKPQIQLKSIVFLPIIVEGRPLGFFSLEYQKEKRLNKREIDGLKKYCVILGGMLTQKKAKKWYQIW